MACLSVVIMPAIQYSGYLEFRSAEMSDISLIMSFFPTEWTGKQRGKKQQGVRMCVG